MMDSPQVFGSFMSFNSLHFPLKWLDLVHWISIQFISIKVISLPLIHVSIHPSLCFRSISFNSFHLIHYKSISFIQMSNSIVQITRKLHACLKLQVWPFFYNIWLLGNNWLFDQPVNQSQLTTLRPNPIPLALIHYSKSRLLAFSLISSFTSQFDHFMFMSMLKQYISKP